MKAQPLCQSDDVSWPDEFAKVRRIRPPEGSGNELAPLREAVSTPAKAVGFVWVAAGRGPGKTGVGSVPGPRVRPAAARLLPVFRVFQIRILLASVLAS